MRLGNIFLVILELTWASESNFVDPNCPTGTKTHALRESLIKGKSPCQFYFANKIFSDYDLSLICSGKCDDQYLQCISNCSSDANCLMDCNRDSVDCSGSCPCHTDCVEGCSGCKNPICSSCNDAANDDNLEACLSTNSKILGECILECNNDNGCKSACVTNFENEHANCPCQENCPNGCPCNNYQCDLPEKKAIMTLSTSGWGNPALLIQPNGDITENFEFTINHDTEVQQSCSAMLNGELFVIGGENKKNQISKVTGCELKRVGDLSFELETGTCATFRFPEERIFLCFGSGYDDQCRSFDGVAVHNHANSTNGHFYTTLGTYKESPLAVGGFTVRTGDWIPHAEIYNIETNTWNAIADYPFHTDISDYATVTTSQGAMIIGGNCWGSEPEDEGRVVALYNEDGWKRLADLQTQRKGHRAIVNGDKVFVIGGHQERYTEIWSTTQNGNNNIQLAGPKLDDYSWYPELALVDINFCVKP